MQSALAPIAGAPSSTSTLNTADIIEYNHCNIADLALSFLIAFSHDICPQYGAMISYHGYHGYLNHHIM